MVVGASVASGVSCPASLTSVTASRQQVNEPLHPLVVQVKVSDLALASADLLPGAWDRLARDPGG